MQDPDESNVFYDIKMLNTDQGRKQLLKDCSGAASCIWGAGENGSDVSSALTGFIKIIKYT